MDGPQITAGAAAHDALAKNRRLPCTVCGHNAHKSALAERARIVTPSFYGHGCHVPRACDRQREHRFAVYWGFNRTPHSQNVMVRLDRELPVVVL
jgi:hypothetical protein